MDKLMAALRGLAVKMILSQKDKIVKGINEKMDLPFLNEKDEAELIEGLWSLIEESVQEASK
tara:strand:- start:787 stop:972 length:186 start_codon:yes stop_codon:yes gene_type:complete